MPFVSGTAWCVGVALLFWLEVTPALAEHVDNGRITQSGTCKHTEDTQNSGDASSSGFIVPLSIEDGSVVVDGTINSFGPLRALASEQRVP